MKHRMVARLVCVAALVGGWEVAEAQPLTQLFKQVSPSVVVIRTKEREVTASTAGGERTVATISGVGSGTLVSADGMVLTAAHVVQTADEITVHFQSGESATATVIASEPAADLSALRLTKVPPGVQPARLGNSDAVEIGEPVFIVGAPYGIGRSLTTGIVSGRHAPDTVYGAMAEAEFFQTDAAINTGNSGGPMFNMKGELIGVVSHIISKSGGFEGLGFVVTLKTAQRIGSERRAFWGGIVSHMLTGPLADIFNLPAKYKGGLLVQRVVERSPAAALGLRGGTIKSTIDGQSLTLGGDIVLEVAGIAVTDEGAAGKIRETLFRLPPGATVKVLVLRQGRELEIAGKLP